MLQKEPKTVSWGRSVVICIIAILAILPLGCSENSKSNQQPTEPTSYNLELPKIDSMSVSLDQLATLKNNHKIAEHLSKLNQWGWSEPNWEQAVLLRAEGMSSYETVLPVFPSENSVRNSPIFIVAVPDHDSMLVFLRASDDRSYDELQSRYNQSMSVADQGVAKAAAWRYAACSYVSRYGIHWSCINRPRYNIGYYYVVTVREGTTWCCPDQSAWYADYLGRLIVCPGRETNVWSLAICGYPPR